MEELIRSVVRLQWCYRINEVAGLQKSSLAEWLSSATYAPSVRAGQIVLSGIDASRYRECIAGDISRLSSAASECLLNVSSVTALPKSYGWQYVKIYYSALFYASALLRVCGISLSYFRTLELQRLKDTMNVYGIGTPFPLKTGQYRISSNLHLGEVCFDVVSGSSGAHDAIWQEFNEWIEGLVTAAGQSNMTDADKLVIQKWLKELKSYISKGNSNASWLSQMRNDIHYRQIGGLWYPYSSSKKNCDPCPQVQVALSDRVDFDTILDRSLVDLLWFRNACLAVIAFSRNALADLHSLCGAKSFLRYGQVQMEAQASKLLGA